MCVSMYVSLLCVYLCVSLLCVCLCVNLCCQRRALIKKCFSEGLRHVLLGPAHSVSRYVPNQCAVIVTAVITLTRVLIDSAVISFNEPQSLEISCSLEGLMSVDISSLQLSSTLQGNVFSFMSSL